MTLDPDPLHVDDDRIPSSKPYRLVPDSPRRGCSVLGFLVILLLVGSATPRSGSDGSLPNMAAVDGGVHVPPPVHLTLSGAPLASVAQLVEHRPFAARRPGSEVAGSSPARWSGAPQDASAVTFEGLATWFPASGYQGAVPWWKPGQDPLVVAVSTFRDGRTYSTSVLVTGWCACGDRDGLPTVIDLSPRAFAELAPLSVGVLSVQVELPTQGPVLPATDQ